MMKYYIPSILIIIFFTACNHEAYEDSFFKNITVTNTSEIKVRSIEIEDVEFDKIHSSLDGTLIVKNENLIFFDNAFSRAFLFDQDGNFIKSRLGIGPGPNELPNRGISFIDTNLSGSLILVGSSNDYHIINPDYERTKSSVIRWQSNHPIEYLQNNPTPTDQRAYDLAYNLGNMKVLGDYAYLPLASAPPPFSKFNLTTELYAYEGRIAAKMNLESGDVAEIIGRLSPVFHQNDCRCKKSFILCDLPSGFTYLR
ncbi:MAG: hypothetical protein ACFCU6_14305 [Balneolaceae bacterium]